ncbi:biphenyl-2,3-diol 1,2-dioxygenase 2 [Colletotrichum cuscutae]|uniref:Biphenyl-2,3-diol 1,2-dioxygenase 2 n=1 Tax=Colletotrichum cuscutae TaxID=1209917 RepID=A0AAI9TVM5_9PEZI|nr:biphenyl-2,3-diol 1,2-dioxygenase 2 [Colletotrichum cuscutae]
MDLDFSQKQGLFKSPKRVGHVVFKTNQFRVMVDFYVSFLGCIVAFENEALSILRFDDEDDHHRVAIVELPGLKTAEPQATGLEHVAFCYSTLADLLSTYQTHKANGITPYWCVNHGPTTSLYYKDPDGNGVELLVDNFDTIQEANDSMASSLFVENPIGTEFDPDDVVRRLEQGESESALKRRVEIGPRKAFGC